MKCRYCQGSTTGHPWGALTCDSCGSVLAENPPTSEELVAFYDQFLDSYHGGGAEGGSAERQEKWAAAYLKQVQRYARSGALLDIGPANNPFPVHASKAGFAVSVLDFKRPERLPDDVEFIAGSLNDPPARLAEYDSTFDVVTSWAVLEHCLDTERAVEAHARFCKPGGYIIVTTPQADSLADRYAAGRTPWFYPPEHLFLVSPRALRRLFGKHGCRPVRIGTFEINPARWLARAALTGAEALAGIGLRMVAPGKWARLREARLTKAAGITIAVFQKA